MIEKWNYANLLPPCLCQTEQAGLVWYHSVNSPAESMPGDRRHRQAARVFGKCIYYKQKGMSHLARCE